MKIYNTLHKEIEDFKPKNSDFVSLYTCGPTVYNYPHIGNYRAYVFGDILKRYLNYKGYKVNHVMNITDIDDKTIRDSIKEGKSLKDFTEFYTEEFFKDRDSLNIIKAGKYTKATDYIPQMVSLIEVLIEKGFAYKTEDGSVYFDIKKDKEYGKLSHFNLNDLKENAKGRMANDEYDKENAQDFALWKAWDENDGDVFWETTLGKGRPGWHIECSAMSMDVFGNLIDIHTGGVDNIFPHHENEIAQSECATGKEFVKYWMHNEHLLVDNKKMSKSSGNFYTLADLKEKGISPIAYRYWLYTGHYRTRVNFTIETALGSQTALNRLYEAFKNLGNDLNGTVSTQYKNNLISLMDEDLDTPKSLALLWELVHDDSISKEDKRATMLDFDNVFGFGFKDIKEEIIPENIKILAEERNKARLDKDFNKSDEIREEIKGLGYEVKDKGDGFEIKKL